MSAKRSKAVRVIKPAARAAVFAALGDQTRLALIARLAGRESRSIAELTVGCGLTRQAVTKHLRVLERAGLVHSARSGREAMFALDLKPVHELNAYLADIERQWEEALGRLKRYLGEG
jgi:DNA-binding transcriptional ArsR family regulator